jgi:hypothetical protein
MPLQKLNFRPGVNREGTTLTNEGGWYASNKIRFRSGQPEKIGGWVKDNGTVSSVVAGIQTTNVTPTSGTFWGVCRSLWNWTTLIGLNLMGFGTNLKFYIQSGVGGYLYDVTPIRKTSSAVANAFTTFTTTQVRVNDPGHGAQTGDFVTITATSGAVNGIPAATMGTTAAPVEYVITYIDSNSYYITTSAAATSSGTSAVTATFAYQLTTGSTIYTQSLGWGAGPWGGFNSGVALTAVSGGTLSNSNTTVTVVDTTSFTASGNILIDQENITYTGKTATTFTGCTRGISGAGSGAATTHANGANVFQSTAFAGWGQAATSGQSIPVQLRLWSQSNYGQNLIINPRGGSLYLWTVNASPTTYDRATQINTSTTGDSSCPSAINYVLVSDASRFTIAFGANDPSGVYFSTTLNPMLVRWSDQDTAASPGYNRWTPAITNQAGDYLLSHGSQIVAAIQTRQEILILTDAAIYSMQYLGPPYVWGFQIMGDNISIAGPNAIATANNITYWMGMDKFYMYSGRVETLPSTLRQYVYEDINLSQSYQFFASTSEGFSEVWFFYCSQSGSSGTGTASNPNTVIDRYVIFNHLERTWAYGNWDTYKGAGYNWGRTAWLDTAIRNNPVSTAYGAENGSTNGIFINQEVGIDDAIINPPTPIVSYIESSDFDIGDGHNFGYVWRLIPDITFNGSTANLPNTNFTVLPRANPGANYSSSNNPAVTSTQNYANYPTYEIQQFTQQVYVRIRGRQMAFQVSSGTTGSATAGLGVQWQLGAPRIDVKPDGRR